MQKEYAGLKPKTEAVIFMTAIYKKLLAETLQQIETLGLPERQEQATKSIIKKNFYSYLNELGMQVDYEEVGMLVAKRQLNTFGSFYNENYQEVTP